MNVLFSNITLILDGKGEITSTEIQRQQQLIKRQARINETEMLELSILNLLKNGMSREDIIAFIGMVSTKPISEEQREKFEELCLEVQKAIHLGAQNRESIETATD